MRVTLMYMTATHATQSLPPVPLTLEGASVLHQMFKIRWAAWRALDPASRAWILEEASHALVALEEHKSAAFALLGHKGDLMLVHFREGFDQLGEVEAML